MDRVDLEVKRYAGPHRWYWALSDSDGALIADHEVELRESDRQWAAFTRLSRYLRLNVKQASPLSSEAEIISWLGQWIGENAFGPIGPALLDRTPATVALHFSPDIPAKAEMLMFRPWELAVVDGLPLARQDVSLVMVPRGTSQHRPKDAIGDRLRMLAVFSLPDAAPALVLREQRQALVRLVAEISKRKGKAIELSVLQYDVNRDRLSEALEDGAGWDIVHFSGHGLVDGLVLEGAQGEQDTVPAGKLIDLLHPNRRRLKLLVLSSCNSAAAPPAEALATRFGPPDDGEDHTVNDAESHRMLPVLAMEAARRLDCGVLAMRYTVDDDFSIALADQLYSSMLGSAQPLTRALQLALPKALGDRPRPGVPPLSVGIPALFGYRCLDLVLAPPAASAATFDTGNQKMAYFPHEPEHLVGRSGVMGRAARVLTGNSPVGVMFTGPAGIGKTACAVELAYRHENSFGALVHWRVPANGGIGSLKDFAHAMEDQLSGLKMVSEVATAAKLSAFLPKLTELMEREAILVLVDGIDELLTSDGYWRDPFWEKVTAALLKHRGLSRLVLSCRQPPRVLFEGLAIDQLHPLTAQESVLLARQLPTLGSLMRRSSEVPIQEAKLLLAQALTSAAGNPAAICARDRELSATNPAEAVQADAPFTVYVDLIERWMHELI